MALRKNIRSTSKQIQSLVEYMSTHSSFANGEFYGPMGRRAYNEEWVRLQHLMRNYGPDKTVEQWRMTWRDLKKKARIDGLRHKAALAKSENEFVQDISETSQKVLEIIGWDSASGIGLEETGLNDFSLLPVASPPPAQSHSKSHHTTSNSLTEPSTSRVPRTGAKGQVSDEESWEVLQNSEDGEPSEYKHYDGDNDENDDNDSTQEDPIKYEDQDPLSKLYENTEASGSTPEPRKRKMYQLDSTCNTVRLAIDAKNDVKPVKFIKSPKIRRIAPKSTEKYMPRDHTYHANVPRDGAVAKLKQEDEFDTFGKHIANQLRKLSTLKYILAQEEIQCTVTKFRMEDFNR